MATNISSCSKILAKENETLEKHTDKALDFLLKFFKWQECNIKKVAEIAKLNVSELKSRLFATVYLHDIGKASVDFQNHIRGKGRGMPHALLSLPFLISAIPTSNVRYESLAVMSHHTPFYDDLYRDYRDATFEGRYCLEKAEDFYRNLPTVHETKLGYNYPYELRDPKFGSVSSVLDDLRDQVLFSPPKTREIFSLFVTCLHYADWLSSGDLSDYQYYEKNIKRKLDEKMTGVQGFSDWYSFQEKAAHVKGNLLLRIPTGQGKTEGALLWADRNTKKGKLMYFLPTRVTSNAMYERLQEYFGDNVGVSHGTSALTIYEEMKQKNELKDYMSKKLLSSVFMMPITVATVDQLLLAGFNWYHWEVIEQNVSFSAVVFDEIHSYDLYTTSLILIFVEALKDKGAKLAFMSATFPDYLVDALNNILGESILIYDKNYENLCRHRIHVFETHIEEGIPDILKKYDEGKKILVITNTVGKSIEIYEKLKGKVDGKDIVLYHSRFIERDRRIKEKQISDGTKRYSGFIAVTTQVVEVSLNIDYDFLYTEVAPIDALVQRMGRVNRKGKKKIADVFIFEPCKGSSYVYGDENIKKAKEILTEVNGKKVTEGTLKAMVEQQYPKEKMLKELEAERKLLKCMLRGLREDLWQIQTLQLSEKGEILRKFAKTREEKLPNKENFSPR